MAGPRDGGNGAAGPGGPGGLGNDAGGASTPDWSGFERSIRDMGDNLGARLTQELGSRLDTLRTTVDDGLNREPPMPEVDPNEGFDFDAATPRQLYDHMVGQFQSMMDTVLENTLSQVLTPYAEEISSLRGDVVRDRGNREIEGLQSKHKEFADFVPEMKELTKKHPSLSLTEVFQLARATNPTKAQELDRKYNPPPPPPARPFALGPSSGAGNTAGADGRPRAMTKSEAAMDAFRQVNERHGGALGALEDAFPNL